MENSRAAQLGKQIRFVCTSHSAQVPMVTMHDQQWAYCPGGHIAARQGHFWTAIEPTTVTDAEAHRVRAGDAPMRMSQGT